MDAVDETEVKDQSKFTSVSEEESDIYTEHELNAKQYFESNDIVIINLEDVLLCMSDFSHELPSNDLQFIEVGERS